MSAIEDSQDKYPLKRILFLPPAARGARISQRMEGLVMSGTPRRRNDLARMKAKARRLYPHDPKARNANHLAKCSCWMCGNQRRIEGAPISERRRFCNPRENHQ